MAHTTEKQGSRGLGGDTSRVIGARVPNRVADQIQRRADAEGKSVSEFARDALLAAAAGEG